MNLSSFRKEARHTMRHNPVPPHVIYAALHALVPLISKMGKQQVAKYRKANTEGQIKLLKKWSLYTGNLALRVALQNKRAARRVATQLDSILNDPEKMENLRDAGRAGVQIGQAYSSAKKGKQKRIAMKKNPLARRNHHLVVGERVKLSAEGLRRFPSQITQGVTLSNRVKKQLRGTVTSVKDWGYSVKLNIRLPSGEEGPWVKRAVPMQDDWVVSAESTSRRWPGNHYEGVDPMAKKNRGARRNAGGWRGDWQIRSLAGSVVKGMKKGLTFDEAYDEATDHHQTLPARERISQFHLPDFRRHEIKEQVRRQIEHDTPGSYTARLFNDPENGRARRNMAIRRLPGGGYEADTVAEMVEFERLSLPGPSKLAGFTADFSKKQRASTAPTLEDKKVGNAVMKLLGGKDVVCPGYRPRTRAARLSTNKLKRLGMSRQAQAAFLDEAEGLSPKQAMKLAVEHYGLVCRAKSNPHLEPSPTIGFPEYYRQPRNAGPYTPQTFPYGYGGRPATYKTAKKNSSARRWSRYAIQMQGDYPGWAGRGPIEANWTSYPTYAYEQFARANGRKPMRQTWKGSRKLKSVPKTIKPTPRSAAEGLYALSKRGPKWPIGDLFHARLALIYAMAPSNWSVHEKVLAAVKRAYPQYNWDKWWADHMRKLQARGRKDKTLSSKIEMAAANPRKISALILK